MAKYEGALQLTRPHWAGLDADNDIHLEIFDGDVQVAFGRDSLFQSNGWSHTVDLEGKSNTHRIEQFGGTAVRSRASGDTLVSSRVVNEKRTVTVERAQYTRTELDYIDDWTAPDRSQQIALAHGRAHALTYDRFHIKGLINASKHTVPASLKANNEFYDGIRETIVGWDAADDEATANAFIRAVYGLREEFTYRNLDIYSNEFVLLVRPSLFKKLFESDKLTNMLYGAGQAGNNYIAAQMAELAGYNIVSTATFPRATGAIVTDGTTNEFGEDWEFDEEDVRTEALLFHTPSALTTVWAHGFVSEDWQDKNNHKNVLDTYAMYLPFTRRSDGVAALLSPQ